MTPSCCLAQRLKGALTARDPRTIQCCHGRRHLVVVEKPFPRTPRVALGLAAVDDIGMAVEFLSDDGVHVTLGFWFVAPILHPLCRLVTNSLRLPVSFFLMFFHPWRSAPVRSVLHPRRTAGVRPVFPISLVFAHPWSSFGVRSRLRLSQQVLQMSDGFDEIVSIIRKRSWGMRMFEEVL